MNASTSEGPLVSVVTPCLNPGAALRRCLESVAGQKYRPIEHIVIDGGSVDGTIDLLKQHPIHYVSEPDGGQTAALNKGLRLARGKLLTWLNADDELVADATERVASAFHRTGAEWIFGDCEVVDDSGTLERVIHGPSSLQADTFDQGNVLAQPGTFFTAEAVRGVGFLDDSFDLAMDFDLWIRLLDSGVKSVHVPHILSRFHVHQGSKTGSVPAERFVLEEARSLFKNGRPLAAHIAIGRAAVLAEQPRTVGDKRRYLEDVRRKQRALRSAGAEENTAVAAALTEAVLADPGPGKLPYLLTSKVWSDAAQRERARRALRATAARVIAPWRRRLTTKHG